MATVDSHLRAALAAAQTDVEAASKIHQDALKAFHAARDALTRAAHALDTAQLIEKDLKAAIELVEAAAGKETNE